MLCAADRVGQRTKCMSHKGKRLVDVQQLQDIAQTGDLLLFSSRHAASNVTKCFTASAWDHVGVVMKPAPGFCFVAEWAGGIYVSPLTQRLVDYNKTQGRLIALRRLKVHISLRYRLESFVERAMAAGLGEVPPSVDEILRAVVAQWGRRDGKGRRKREALGYAESRRLSHGDMRTDLQALFCSKFVAAAYKNAGLIRSERASSEFLPKHFSSAYNFFLNLQNASLGDETAIVFTPPRTAAHAKTASPLVARRDPRLLLAAAAAATNGGVRPSMLQQRAARTVAAAWRGRVARRELERRRRQRALDSRPCVRVAVARCLACLLGRQASLQAEQQMARARRFNAASEGRMVPLVGTSPQPPERTSTKEEAADAPAQRNTGLPFRITNPVRRHATTE